MRDDRPVTVRPAVPPVRLRVRAPLCDAELNALFTASWPAHEHTDFGARMERSLLWVAAFRDDELVGYVNVVGDGGVHAFVLDTTVHPCVRRQGVGVRLVRRAADEARLAGARWLHVDHEQHLTGFYTRCGFGPTAAGLRWLG
ncbi:GNAT family N-acetyltransferase [Streptomyces bathyalis]|uniref:GNAT family N-acetyltransferase n=1 Tax=Streptomyces bathyalis TaxID=2710756 RepID=A0A7T1TDH3_9ACTN|nr:GNAT family N-acetyltransferase [Streptomyces bathyalis]